MGSENNTEGVQKHIEKQIEISRQVLEAISVLKNAEAIITIWLPKTDFDKAVTFEHSRDVASDSDTYKQVTEKPEDLGREVGWIIPFETSERVPAFVTIDASDFSSSVHFLVNLPGAIGDFNQFYKDRYSPGRKIDISEEETGKIHTDVPIPHEEKTERLIPTNPDHIVKINDYLQTAIQQATERVEKSIEARTENSQKTTATLINFLKSIQPRDKADNN
ncbi:hypothetical protein HYT59_00160 [Candidatus Woesebacteria bacterium]|nr:hypothetical protein [Candidatus Woesebacteria bacterium]